MTYRYDIVSPVMLPEQFCGNDLEHDFPFLFGQGLVAPQGRHYVRHRLAKVPVGELREHPSAGVEAGIIWRDNAHLVSGWLEPCSAEIGGGEGHGECV